MARWGEPKNVSVFSGREAWAYGHGNQLILADEDGSGLRLIGWRIGLHSGINPAYRAYKTWDEPKVLVPHATFTIDNVRLVKQRMTPSAVIEIFGNPDELFARDLPDGSEMWWLGYVMGGIADENVFCVDPQLGLITWRVDHMSP